MAGARAASDAGSVTLFSRVVAINAAVLVTAVILLALSPATVSPTLQLADAVVLAIGPVLMISVNLLLMRRVFGPLEQLTRVMRTVNAEAPVTGLRAPIPTSHSSATYRLQKPCPERCPRLCGSSPNQPPQRT